MSTVGNDDRSLRKFLRKVGVPPTAGNMEIIGREVRRTQQQNERIDREHREIAKATGRPTTYDAKGDVHARIRERVQRDLKRRGQR